jgi:tRNA pseudouridine38-40 synthase
VKAGGISQDNAGDFTKVQWTRAARTDKGVSAVGQCIALRMVLDPPGVLERINEALPEGFKFFGYKRVTGGFNAKTMCDRRRYEYVIPTLAFDPRRCLPRKEVEAEAALAAEAAEQGIDGAVRGWRRTIRV